MPTANARISTGVEGLDDILGGGLPPHRMYLVLGDPGVGKTTLALQFLMAGVRNGEATLYVTLSETSDELAAVARSHGWTLDGIDVFEMSTVDVGVLEEENTLYVPAEVELGERMRALLAEVERVAPRRLVIDSVSELRLLAQTQLRFRRQLLALKRDLEARDCTLVLLENPVQREGDVLLQSLVHGVIRLEQLAPGFGAERRRLRVLKLREVKFRGGDHDMNLDRGGVRVFPRLVAAEHKGSAREGRLSSGVANLDRLLGGGLDRGTSTLLLGPAGSGKSALSTLFVRAAMASGSRAAIFAFDEGVETLCTRSAGLGMDLGPHLAGGRLLLQQVDPAELSSGELVHRVREAVEDGAQVVVIDSLNGFLSAMPDQAFLVVHLHELLSYMRQQGVVTILVEAQHGLLGETMATPVDVSYLADTVVLLRYFEDEGRVRRALSVLKKRTGAHEDTIRELKMSAEGLDVGPALRHLRGVLRGVPVPHGPTPGAADE